MVRYRAAQTLGEWGHRAEAVPALIGLLGHADAASGTARPGRWASGGHRAEAVPALIGLLEDAEPVRYGAARTLGEWGHRAEAVPALIGLLGHADAGSGPARPRRWASGAIGPRPCRP